VNLPSNTPPDGDFVRYVERLTSANANPDLNAHASAGLGGDRLKPEEKPSRRTPSPTTAATPSAKPAFTSAGTSGGAAFITHVKWVVILWFATQALSALVPGAGFLFLPALLVYGVWAIFQANRASSGALLQRLRELAEQAAEEARKNQLSKKK